MRGPLGQEDLGCPGGRQYDAAVVILECDKFCEAKYKGPPTWWPFIARVLKEAAAWECVCEVIQDRSG